MTTVLPALPTSTEPRRAPKGADASLVIAINKIVMSDPSAELVHTGRYDAEGNAIIRKASLTIHPGEFFRMTDAAELTRLLDLEAVRYPTASEIALRELASAEQSEVL